MSLQAYGLLPKIKQLDDLLQLDKRARRVVCEVHPEVSFAIWSGRKPMRFGKKTREGRAERRALIDRRWPGQIDRVRDELWGAGVAWDDLLDALAALWTAERWCRGEAIVLGDKRVDAKGLPMRIVA